MIIFCTNNIKFLFSHRAEIVQEAVEKYNDVIVFAPKSDEYEYCQHTKIKFVFSHQGNALISIISDALQFFMLAIKHRSAVFHIITLRSIVYAGLVSKLLSLKTVIAISGLGSVFSSNALRYCIFRPLITFYLRFIYSNLLLHIVFQNSDDIELFKKNKFLNHLKGHSLLNGSGVDLNFYSQSELPKNGPIKVLFASRLLKDKGIYDFVDAAKILESTHKNIQFFIAGSCDANNPNSLTRAEIEEISLLKNVEYLGQISHMSALIASIHLLVLPSYYGEGMPKVLLEAAACGRPVITTDNPGCRDAIINNKTGILVPIKSPSAISKSILSLVENQKKLYEMSCNARSHALAKFDVKNIVREHVKIYDDLINCDHT